MLPLVGVKVVEISKDMAGFYAGMILADLGAEVIKIEKPGADPARNAGPIWRAAKFVAYNRNKKSLALDLNSNVGKEVLLKLLKDSDIFLEDLEQNAINNLGFSYNEVSKLNPMVAYISIKDCLEGPYENRSWTGAVMEAEAGLMCSTNEPDPPQALTIEGPPVSLGLVPVIQHAAGIYGALWAMCTLLTRKKEGKGEYIRVGKFETAVTLVGQWYNEFTTYKLFEKHAARLRKTKDGQWAFYNIAGNDRNWKTFCEAFGVSEEETKATEKLKDRPRDKANKIQQEVTESRTKEEIWRIINKLPIPAGVVNNIKTVVEEDPHMKATRFLVPLKLSPDVALTPEEKTFLNPLLPLADDDYNPDVAKRWTPPPKLGEHSFEILKGLGYSESEIFDLRKNKIISP